MAWKNQGGPWGGGGNGGGQGPWGGRGGGGPSMPEPPDLEELLRRGQDRFRRALPGGFGGGRVIGLAVLAGIALWFASGFYRVQPGELGVELLFGKYLRLTTPGLNYWLPRPIGQVITPNVDRTNQINIGFRGAGEAGGAVRDVPQEGLMLTGDQNIIDIDFVVQWRIKNASDFLFNIREPEPTIKIAAESAMREIVGQTSLEDALTVKRQEVEARMRDLLQGILDEYGAGVAVADAFTVPALPQNWKGLTIGFLDNTKANFDRLTAEMGELLRGSHGVAKVVHRRKANASTLAAPAI